MSLGRPAPHVVDVPPSQARELAHAGALLLDVREHDEWRAGLAPVTDDGGPGQVR